jgi:hypothetical protein
VRIDVGVAVGIFIVLMIFIAVLSFIGWDRWSDLTLP